MDADFYLDLDSHGYPYGDSQRYRNCNPDSHGDWDFYRDVHSDILRVAQRFAHPHGNPDGFSDPL